MITAKELFNKMLLENEECISTEMMIEFAKLHIIEALQKASEKITDGYDYHKYGNDVLDAYSFDNVV